MDRARRSEYTPNDLLGFRETGTLDITPKFQRRSVWRTPQRSFFIDTLLKGLPVPPIYLRETQSDDFTRTIRQVVDGQQRIRAVLDFIDGEYALSRAVGGAAAGKRFGKLAQEEQDAIRNYHFSAEVFAGITDAQVLEIFARMNSYSVQLNRQELRNGKYFGHFKRSCYELALEHLEYWRGSRLFTEQAIARMLETELTSELIVLILDGPQDKKASIDRFYAEFDEDFPKADLVAQRFRSTIDLLTDIVPPRTLAESAFRSVPLFYSLFGAVYHLRFGSDFKAPSLGRKLSETEREAVEGAALKLSSIIEAAREEEAVPKKYQRFVTACLSQTDNIQPRRTRVEAILNEAALS